MATKYIQLTIIDIIRETADAATFVITVDNTQAFCYRSGQFLTLVFSRGSREIRRSYSFSSTPAVDTDYRFTVKRVHNGEISRLLLDTYQKGDKLYAISPAGMFTYEKSDTQKDIFFFAAGSGITPIFSLIKHILYTVPSAKVNLIYQNNTEAASIFRQQLVALASRFEQSFTWIDYVSQSATGISRKLTNDQVEVLIPQLMQYERKDALFYICGPLSFMRMCQYTILLMGFLHHQLKKEYFVIDIAPPAPLINNPSAQNVTIHQKEQQIQFVTLYPATILQSALNQKIELPYSCKGGRCSACAARCVSGKVVMSMNDVLTETDIANGLILTCVGYALTDIVLDYE